jgi:hypothetical protein
MSDKVLELKRILAQDAPSSFVSQTWDTYHKQRLSKVMEWLELRNYIFATDTSGTTVGALPWKNRTTIPKLCQIRDNLHSNYMAALFPNDNWLSWEAYTRDSANKDKAQAIETYMSNKCRENHFMTEMSKLVYDYIDYGNAFCTVEFESRYKELPDGSQVVDYIGPVPKRISPMDIVMNPLGDNFKGTYKIVRSVKSVGELKKLAVTDPEQAFWLDAIKRRERISTRLNGYRYEDFQKAVGYQIDGFGNMFDYYMGSNMEILEFYGDFLDPKSGELQCNKIVTVVDRSFTVRVVDMPQWYGSAPIWHVGWRFRQDNLWSMGPLDNLVGMQYRIDHLENAKADAVDLIVQPPLVIRGEVEQFDWGPSAEIHVDENGSVEVLSQNMNHIAVQNNEIQQYEDRMELYAGAPREAMGIRTPGEKTAFEVQQLQNAAGRIFQEKATQFEIEMLEPVLNGMLETARRNMDGSDIIRTMDDDLGVQQFITITKEDITAIGKLRPVGARHFAKQSQDLQNLMGVFSNQLVAQMIAPHTSGIALTDFINDVVDLKGYKIFQPNVAIDEQYETQSRAQQAQEDLQVQQQTPLPPVG